MSLSLEDKEFIAGTIAPLEVKVTHLEKEVQALSESWFGNGKPGVKVRLDRLEQKEEGRKWMERAVLITMLGLVVTTVYNLLTGQ